jgi:hypothetical protein
VPEKTSRSFVALKASRQNSNTLLYFTRKALLSENLMLFDIRRRQTLSRKSTTSELILISLDVQTEHQQSVTVKAPLLTACPSLLNEPSILKIPAKNRNRDRPLRPDVSTLPCLRVFSDETQDSGPTALSRYKPVTPRTKAHTVTRTVTVRWSMAREQLWTRAFN